MVSIILVSVFSIIILTSFSGYRERLPIFVNARSMLASNEGLNLRFEAIKLTEKY